MVGVEEDGIIDEEDDDGMPCALGECRERFCGG